MAENVEEGLRSTRLRINCFSKATFTIWLLTKKFSEEVANLPLNMTILASCLYEKSISAHFDARFFFTQLLDFIFTIWIFLFDIS